ncbi:MAG: aldolase/citrate lyase family protein [Clostridiales bacterium]
MPTYITAAEIATCHIKGEKVFACGADAVLTDLAREEVDKLGIELIRQGDNKGMGTQPQSASQPQAQVQNPAPSPKQAKSQSGGTYGVQGFEPPAPLTYKRPFKEVLGSGRKIAGTFIGTPHPVMTEFVGKLGFDFLCIDAEHTPIHLATLQEMLQSMGATPTYGVVRVPMISYQYMSGALDIGADALLIPQIRTGQDMDIVEQACLYPPQGRRGIGPSRATSYGLEIGKKGQEPNRDTAIIIQIETKEALDNLDAVISRDIVDMVFIGPGDLSMNLGVFGQTGHPIMVEQIGRIQETAGKYGKPIGIFAGNMEAAANWLDKGFDMVLINSELGLLGEHITGKLAALRSHM